MWFLRNEMKTHFFQKHEAAFQMSTKLLAPKYLLSCLNSTIKNISYSFQARKYHENVTKMLGDMSGKLRVPGMTLL
jgi:hypothetical protein